MLGRSKGGLHRPRTLNGLLVITVLLTAAPGMVASSADPSPVDASCVSADRAVQLVDHEPTTYHLAGWLCADDAAGLEDGRTVIIASPSGLSNHAYWDWPQEAETYSFVRDAIEAGYSVYNYDRIGTGQSDRPAAALVTVQSEAFVIHQLVDDLRAGEIGGVAFDKVVLLGNSLSVFISVYEAETYRDVDGLINTGIIVGPLPQGLAALFSTFYPAQFDPKFQDEGIPLGYATMQPGSRKAMFHLPGADPATVALDEELKDTATLGEAATFPTWMPLTRTVDVPVLSVLGDRDILFCDPVCGQAEADRERTFWSPETCFEIEILPDTGHFVQLHTQAAPAFGELAVDWLDRRIGVGDATLPSEPCTL